MKSLILLMVIPLISYGQAKLNFEDIDNLKSVVIITQIIDKGLSIQKDKTTYMFLKNKILEMEILEVSEFPIFYSKPEYDLKGNIIETRVFEDNMENLHSITLSTINNSNRPKQFLTKYYKKSGIEFRKVNLHYNRKGLLVKRKCFSTNERYKSKFSLKKYSVIEVVNYKYNKKNKLLLEISKRKHENAISVFENYYSEDTLKIKSTFYLEGDYLNSPQSEIRYYNQEGMIQKIVSISPTSNQTEMIFYNNKNNICSKKVNYNPGQDSNSSIDGILYDFKNEKEVEIYYKYNELDYLTSIEHFVEGELIGQIKYEYTFF